MYMYKKKLEKKVTAIIDELASDDPSVASYNFDLYLKYSKLKQIYEFLSELKDEQNIELLNEFRDNYEYIISLFKKLLDKTLTSFENMKLNDDSRVLSIKIAYYLREIIDLINFLFSPIEDKE